MSAHEVILFMLQLQFVMQHIMQCQQQGYPVPAVGRVVWHTCTCTHDLQSSKQF